MRKFFNRQTTELFAYNRLKTITEYLVYAHEEHADQPKRRWWEKFFYRRHQLSKTRLNQQITLEQLRNAHHQKFLGQIRYYFANKSDLSLAFLVDRTITSYAPSLKSIPLESTGDTLSAKQLQLSRLRACNAQLRACNLELAQLLKLPWLNRNVPSFASLKSNDRSARSLLYLPRIELQDYRDNHMRPRIEFMANHLLQTKARLDLANLAPTKRFLNSKIVLVDNELQELGRVAQEIRQALDSLP